jgi:hypothetical protein
VELIIKVAAITPKELNEKRRMKINFQGGTSWIGKEKKEHKHSGC